MRAASSDGVGSAMEDVTDGFGAGGVVVGGLGFGSGGWEVDEDRLEADTRLSRAPASRVEGPRLRSS